MARIKWTQTPHGFLGVDSLGNHLVIRHEARASWMLAYESADGTYVGDRRTVGDARDLAEQNHAHLVKTGHRLRMHPLVEAVWGRNGPTSPEGGRVTDKGPSRGRRRST